MGAGSVRGRITQHRELKHRFSCAVLFLTLDVFTHFKPVSFALVSRWWKCQPAWRHISERKTTSCLQEEKDDRTGVRGSPSEPDLQDAEGARHICPSLFPVTVFEVSDSGANARFRCPPAASARS